MYRKLIIPLLFTAIMGTVCWGCGKDTVQHNTEFSGGFIAEIETEQTKKVALSDDIDTEGTLLGPWYASEQQILPIENPVNIHGISYEILSYEQTKEFGDRNLDTLSDWIDIDSNGNLTDDATYIFVTLRITNNTESTIHINRTQGSIVAIKPDLEIKLLCAEPIYIDEYWTGGNAAEVFFYDLGAGESITCEVGYHIPTVSLESATFYYEFKDSDDLGDPKNRFCMLEDLQ